MTVVGIGRYKTLPLDEDLDGLDRIPSLCIQDCIVLSFKKLQERHAENPSTVRNNEPALDQFAESVDLLLSHRLKNKKNSFWNLVKEISFNDVVQTITKLSSVTTNAGKARAWIYLAIQDQLLQCYLTQLTEDRKLLGKFYKADATICDQEMMFSISSLVSGLEVMTFDISIDCPSFDLGVAPSYSAVGMEGAQRALWGASTTLNDIGESINESVAMHMPFLFKGAGSDVLNGKDSTRLGVGGVPSHYSSTPSINSYDSLECSSLNSFEEEGNTAKRGSIAQARRGIRAKRKNRKERTGIASEVTDQFATTDFDKSEFKSSQTDVASASEPVVTQNISGSSGLFSEDVVGSCDVLTLMADKLQEASRAASPSLQPKMTAFAYLRQMNSSLSADKGQTLANVVEFNDNANADKSLNVNKDASKTQRSTLVAPTISIDPPVQSVAENQNNHNTGEMNNGDAISLAESANGAESVLDYEETPGRERRNDTFFKGEEIDGVRVIQVDLGTLESSGSSHGSDSSSTQHHNTIQSSSNKSGSTVVVPDTSTNGAQNLPGSNATSLFINELNNGQVKFEESNASAFITSMFSDIASSPQDTESNENDLQLVPEKIEEETDHDELKLESSLAVSNWLFSDGELSNSYSNTDNYLGFNKEPNKNKTDKNAATLRPNELQIERNYEEIEHAEIEESVDELALLGTGVPTTSMPPSPLDMMNIDAKQSNLANILSATLYMEHNALAGEASEASHKADLFIDHMMKLSFELKVYQFNQDGEEEPIKLYRGFYRHMEMPSSWTRNAYHARPIDLLLTNRCIYFLKFDGEKADSLHYFFPLDELSLITTYPFEQGIKFFSRRQDEAEWAKLTMHDNKRINEFWFETGDSHFTQQIIKKLKETISVYWSDTHAGSINFHPQQQPQFGAEPIMELAQLSSFMAFTFNYEGEYKHQVRLFSLVFMGESPPLYEDFLFQSGGSGTHTPRSNNSANITGDNGVLSSQGSGNQVSYDGILWSKEDASNNLVGGFIRKPSLTLARNTVWRDYHFSIRNGVLYKAEYMTGGKISQPEMVVSLAECSSCKMYRDADRSYTFLLTSSKANQGLAKLLQNSRAGSRLLAPSVTYSFAARNERDATEWVHAIRKFLPSSSGQRSKGRLIPVKAGALVVDNFNAAVCRYERDREEFYSMEKFSLLNISRVITPTDMSLIYKSNTLISHDDDLEYGMRMLSAPEVELTNGKTHLRSNADLNYVIIDFQPTAEAKGEEDDDFEIVENTNLVDNLLPMVLFFCCEKEAASFVSIIQEIVSHATIHSLSAARLSSYVTRSLEKTQTDINRTRMLNK